MNLFPVLPSSDSTVFSMQIDSEDDRELEVAFDDLADLKDYGNRE